MWIKIATLLVLLIIIGSLFSALTYLLKSKPGDTKVVKALTVRIGLSIFLFSMLILAAQLGYVGHPL